MDGKRNEEEYQRLISEGYIESSLIPSLEKMGYPMGTIGIREQPLAPGREDMEVQVTDKFGETRKPGYIMMGYNDEKIELGSGIYISWNDFSGALRDYLGTNAENMVYYRTSTKEVVDQADILEQLLKATTTGVSYLSQVPTDTIPNQMAADMIVTDQHGVAHPKGVSMYGSEGFELPSGDYVSRLELVHALEDYVKLSPPVPVIAPEGEIEEELSGSLEGDAVPKIPPIVPKTENTTPKESPTVEPVIPTPPTITPAEEIAIPTNTPIPPTPPGEPPLEEERTNNKENETHRVIQRMYRRPFLIPIAIGMATLALLGLGRNKEEIQKYIESKVEQTGVEYVVNGEKQVDIFETEDETLKRIYSDVVTGDRVSVEPGIVYHESSDAKYGGANKYGTFGEQRPAGDYNVDGVAVLIDGKIVEQEWVDGKNLAEVLEEVADKHGVSLTELEPMVHLGGPVSGWVEAKDLVSEKDKKAQITSSQVIVDGENEYSDTVENFKGDSITFEVGGKDVTLKIKDEDGNFLEPGSTVIGSDGQSYRLSEFSVEESEIIDVDTVTEVKEGRVNWSVENIAAKEALAVAATSVLASLAGLAFRRKEMVDKTKEEIEQLTSAPKDRYISALGQFEGESEFSKAVETMTGKTIQAPSMATGTLSDSLINWENPINDYVTVERIEKMGEGGKIR